MKKGRIAFAAFFLSRSFYNANVHRQFLSSRPTTPTPFRPARRSLNATSSQAAAEAASSSSSSGTPSITHSLAPITNTVSSAPPSGPDVQGGSAVVAKLEEEAAAEQQQGSGGVSAFAAPGEGKANGHAS